MKVASLTPTFGSIIEADQSTNLCDVSSSDVIEQFTKTGAVLLRGFGLEGDQFTDFSERFGSEFLINGNTTRETVSTDRKTQTVNSGTGLIPPHAEMAYSPFRPDILWFQCLTPASGGGATFLCDGEHIWNRMKPAMRSIFEDQKIKYIFPNLNYQWLSLFIGKDCDGPSIGTTLASIPGLVYMVNSDQTITIEYSISAINRTKYGAAEAFANSVIVEETSSHFEDGTPIPQSLRLELFALACQRAFYLKWHPGDILMVDNSRIMHGREPFGDNSRRIHVRLCRVAGF